jgi:RNA polymerase sigma factor (sigma-70 family)
LLRARALATRNEPRERELVAGLIASWDGYIEDNARLKVGTHGGPDVAQETRRSLARKLLAQSSFDVPFHAVVTRCLRDAVAEHFRWQRRRGTTVMGAEELAEHTDPVAVPGERDPDPRADRRVLSAALEKLGTPDAQIVWMKIIEERPAAQIACTLNLSEGAVNTRYSRACPRLARLIHDAVRNLESPTEDHV